MLLGNKYDICIFGSFLQCTGAACSVSMGSKCDICVFRYIQQTFTCGIASLCSTAQRVACVHFSGTQFRTFKSKPPYYTQQVLDYALAPVLLPICCSLLVCVEVILG